MPSPCVPTLPGLISYPSSQTTGTLLLTPAPAQLCSQPVLPGRPQPGGVCVTAAEPYSAQLSFLPQTPAQKAARFLVLSGPPNRLAGGQGAVSSPFL